MFKGNFLIVYSDKEPQWRLLTQEYFHGFIQRCGIVGYEKARRYVFGESCEHVLSVESCEIAAMVAEKYDGVYKDRVQGLAACIATGTPINPDRPHGPADGGLKVEADRKPPTKPRGGGQAQKMPGAFQALMTG